MTGELSEPDYLFWSKYDEWTFREAALLLHGFDPLQLKEVKFDAAHPPKMPELQGVYKTLLVLKNSAWQELGLGIVSPMHPYAIQIMARIKDLPLPNKLNECLEARRKQEQKNPLCQTSAYAHLLEINLNEKKEVSVHHRERQNFLKIIGLMALIIGENADETSKIKYNDNLSASQLKDIILEKAEALGIELDGLKSADRKISEALILLKQESNLEII